MFTNRPELIITTWRCWETLISKTAYGKFWTYVWTPWSCRQAVLAVQVEFFSSPSRSPFRYLYYHFHLFDCCCRPCSDYCFLWGVWNLLQFRLKKQFYFVKKNVLSYLWCLQLDCSQNVFSKVNEATLQEWREMREGMEAKDSMLWSMRLYEPPQSWCG